MGWESTLYTALSFRKETFENKYQVQSKIDGLNRSIDMNKAELRDLAMMTEPGKMLRHDDMEDGVTASDLVLDRFNSCIEIIEEDIAVREWLLLLLEKWDDCHDKETGLAIPPPDDWKWDTAYFDGDFVKTVNSDDK